MCTETAVADPEAGLGTGWTQVRGERAGRGWVKRRNYRGGTRGGFFCLGALRAVGARKRKEGLLFRKGLCCGLVRGFWVWMRGGFREWLHVMSVCSPRLKYSLKRHASRVKVGIGGAQQTWYFASSSSPFQTETTALALHDIYAITAPAFMFLAFLTQADRMVY